jgi:hypothetical protein
LGAVATGARSDLILVDGDPLDPADVVLDSIDEAMDGIRQTRKKSPDFSGPFGLHRTGPDCLLVAVQGLEPRTLRI